MTTYTLVAILIPTAVSVFALLDSFRCARESRRLWHYNFGLRKRLDASGNRNVDLLREIGNLRRQLRDAKEATHAKKKKDDRRSWQYDWTLGKPKFIQHVICKTQGAVAMSSEPAEETAGGRMTRDYLIRWCQTAILPDGFPSLVPNSDLAKAVLELVEENERLALTSDDRHEWQDVAMKASSERDELRAKLVGAEKALSRSRTWEAQQYAYENQAMGQELKKPIDLAVELESLRDALRVAPIGGKPFPPNYGGG